MPKDYLSKSIHADSSLDDPCFNAGIASAEQEQRDDLEEMLDILLQKTKLPLPDRVALIDQVKRKTIEIATIRASFALKHVFHCIATESTLGAGALKHLGLIEDKSVNELAQILGVSRQKIYKQSSRISKELNMKSLVTLAKQRVKRKKIFPKKSKTKQVKQNFQNESKQNKKM